MKDGPVDPTIVMKEEPEDANITDMCQLNLVLLMSLLATVNTMSKMLRRRAHPRTMLDMVNRAERKRP